MRTITCRGRQIQSQMERSGETWNWRQTEWCLCCCGFKLIKTFYNPHNLNIFFQAWKWLDLKLGINVPLMTSIAQLNCLFFSIWALNKRLKALKVSSANQNAQLTKKSLFKQSFKSPFYYSDCRQFLHESR